MAKQQATKKPKDGQATGSLLKRRVDLPFAGRLGKTVKMPNWLRAIGGYFAGAWHELREVRWPTRRATWGLTLAVIIFTVVLVVLILALDFGFEQLFKRILF